MLIGSSRSKSLTSFRNLHTAANWSHRELSEVWARATVPLVGAAKRQTMRLTWGGAGALDGASIARSSEQSEVEVGICA